MQRKEERERDTQLEKKRIAGLETEVKLLKSEMNLCTLFHTQTQKEERRKTDLIPVVEKRVQSEGIILKRRDRTRERMMIQMRGDAVRFCREATNKKQKERKGEETNDAMMIPRSRRRFGDKLISSSSTSGQSLLSMSISRY